jgi:hypothetical protein
MYVGPVSRGVGTDHRNIPRALRRRRLSDMSTGNGKVVVNRVMSLDGFIAGPGDAMGWIFDFVAEDYFRENALATGAMLVGRRTYEVGSFYAEPHDVPVVRTSRRMDRPRTTNDWFALRKLRPTPITHGVPRDPTPARRSSIPYGPSEREFGDKLHWAYGQQSATRDSELVTLAERTLDRLV